MMYSQEDELMLGVMYCMVYSQRHELVLEVGYYLMDS